MHVNKRTRSGRVAARAGVVLALTAATLVATALPSAAAAPTLSRNRVPSGGGYSLDITLPAGDLTGQTAANTTVQFQVRNPATPSTLTCNTTPLGGAAITANGSGVVQTGVINFPVTTGVTALAAA